MKLTFARTGFFLFLLAFSFLLLPQTTHAAVDESEYIVENLDVNDIPNDDGSGLMLSWKPLPKERRIIEYRVYRGITPDSLFFIGKIDVNVKTGVLAEEMYFYDTDFNYFADTQARGKLRREKGQKKGNPLYRRYPRDVNILGPQLEHYDILGVISEKDYYYHSRKMEVVADEDTTVYAGLKLREFEQLAKKLITDHNYYYTVIAVSESRRYYPHVQPAIGIPRENSPEKISAFYAVYVQDKNRLQFEWSLPTFTDDIYYHRIYMMKKNDLEKFAKYLKYLDEVEKNGLAMKEDSTVVALERTVENPAEFIYQRYSSYPYTPSKTVSINILNNKIIGEKKYPNIFTGKEHEVDVDIDVENIEDYYFVFSLYDVAKYETFSDVSSLDIINSDMLPQISGFNVIDGEDDKGDYNRVMWGKPVVYLTNSTFLDESKTRLLVNYEYNMNKTYKVRNIYFKVFDETGKQIANKNEYYQDKKIIIELPKDSNKNQTLFFEMTFKCNKDLGDDYILTQILSYDEQTRSLYPGNLYLGNENLLENQYYIYKHNYFDEEWRLSKRITGVQREVLDNVRYENVHFKIVKKYDADKNLFLFSSSFGVYSKEDKPNETISSNLFPSEIEKKLTTNRDEIAKYTSSKDTLQTKEELKEADEAIEYHEKQIELITTTPLLIKADSYKNPRNRLKFLDKARHYAKNTFSYKIIKTDGKGHFTESEIYIKPSVKSIDKKDKYAAFFSGFGKDHFYPRSNLFKNTMLPTLIATLLFGLLVYILIGKAKKGHDLFVRPIAGIEEIDNAIGRATEMGKPILFVPGLSGITDVATLAGLAILGKVAKKAAEYDTKILVPCRDYLVLPIAQEIVKEAHYEAGRPDTYDKSSVFFITDAQFAFVAGVNGIMVREKTATNFYMGMFWAEALLMTETGSTTGAIQIAGTDAVTQIPFFITTCDYTLIGEELYAASAYLAREPLQLGTLKAVDYFKFLILIFIIAGTAFSTSHLTFLINAFPEK
ncbi:MAG: hypothetical protein ISS80_01480 [Candidatus Cloacimonetes bacterium]|nr:hypothetical protein [Candidatus Cloacimonadota bacterium]